MNVEIFFLKVEAQQQKNEFNTSRTSDKKIFF